MSARLARFRDGPSPGSADVEQDLAALPDGLGLADGLDDLVEGELRPDLGGEHPDADQAGHLPEQEQGPRDAPALYPVPEPEALDDPLAGDHPAGVDPDRLLRQGPVDQHPRVGRHRLEDAGPRVAAD